MVHHSEMDWDFSKLPVEVATDLGNLFDAVNAIAKKYPDSLSYSASIVEPECLVPHGEHGMAVSEPPDVCGYAPASLGVDSLGAIAVGKSEERGISPADTPADDQPQLPSEPGIPAVGTCPTCGKLLDGSPADFGIPVVSRVDKASDDFLEALRQFAASIREDEKAKCKQQHLTS